MMICFSIFDRPTVFIWTANNLVIAFYDFLLLRLVKFA